MLSALYILLWGELDELSDQHRWLRMTTDKEPLRTAETYLAALRDQARDQRLRYPLLSVEEDFSLCRRLRSEARDASPIRRLELSETLESTKRRFQNLSRRFAQESATRVIEIIVVEFDSPNQILANILEVVGSLPGVRAVRRIDEGVVVIFTDDVKTLQESLSPMAEFLGIKRIYRFLESSRVPLSWF
jgi:hypothetical protein